MHGSRGYSMAQTFSKLATPGLRTLTRCYGTGHQGGTGQATDAETTEKACLRIDMSRIGGQK